MATYYSTVSDPATTARAYGRDLDCSPKSGRNVARAIKGMPVDRAKEFLQSVARLEAPVPFKVRVRKIHHRRGTGFGPGKWPVGVVTRFLKVLESAEANAEYKGLDKERLVITHATAYQGTVTHAMTPRAQGRSTPHYNRKCNFEVIVSQAGEEETPEAPKKAGRAASKPESSRKAGGAGRKGEAES
jgi:large subunit ribosomal protein L22